MGAPEQTQYSYLGKAVVFFLIIWSAMLGGATYWDYQQHAASIWQAHLAVWLFGLISILFGTRFILAKVTDAAGIQQRFQTIFEQSLDGILLVDPTTQRISEFNQKAHQQLGYSREEFALLKISDFEVIENYQAVEQHIDKISQQGWDNFETQHRCKDGSIRDVQVVTKLVKINSKKMIQASFRDISVRKQAQERIKEERDRSQLYLDTVQSLMVALDREGCISMINDYGCRLLGYSEEQLLGKDWFVTCLPGPENLSLVKPYFNQLMQAKVPHQVYFENTLITATGCSILVAWRNSLLYDEQGNIAGTLSAGEDITARKASERKIHNLAFYDPLTKLPNRRLLLDRLQQSMAESARSKSYKALLFLDLDNFKTLNDTLGHHLGDNLLVETSKRILSCLREIDTVSRHGGDEFIVLLESLGTDLNEAVSKASLAAEKIIELLNTPYLFDNHHYQCSVSIGIALYHEHSISVEELIKRADLAMYQAKAEGRNTHRFFDPDMQASLNARIELEKDLRQAVANQAFELYYQPQIDPSGRCVGAEALIRWHSETRGLVSPLDFIPLAEDTLLIVPIGQWVLAQACQQLLLWRQLPIASDLSLSINVSAVQFKQKDFASSVLAQVADSGINPALLKMEITESLLVENIDAVVEKMNLLKNIGISFSLDDFGTGYSSLSYLKRLPLDQLKIDRSFVHDILTDANDAAICRAVIVLGQSLGMDTIAEGVEQSAQWQALQQQGCGSVQGYIYAKPMPIDEFMKWLVGMEKQRV